MFRRRHGDPSIMRLAPSPQSSSTASPEIFPLHPSVPSIVRDPSGAHARTQSSVTPQVVGVPVPVPTDGAPRHPDLQQPQTFIIPQQPQQVPGGVGMPGPALMPAPVLGPQLPPGVSYSTTQPHVIEVRTRSRGSRRSPSSSRERDRSDRRRSRTPPRRRRRSRSTSWDRDRPSRRYDRSPSYSPPFALGPSGLGHPGFGFGHPGFGHPGFGPYGHGRSGYGSRSPVYVTHSRSTSRGRRSPIMYPPPTHAAPVTILEAGTRHSSPPPVILADGSRRYSPSRHPSPMIIPEGSRHYSPAHSPILMQPTDLGHIQRAASHRPRSPRREASRPYSRSPTPPPHRTRVPPTELEHDHAYAPRSSPPLRSRSSPPLIQPTDVGYPGTHRYPQRLSRSYSPSDTRSLPRRRHRHRDSSPTPSREYHRHRASPSRYRYRPGRSYSTSPSLRDDGYRSPAFHYRPRRRTSPSVRYGYGRDDPHIETTPSPHHAQTYLPSEEEHDIGHPGTIPSSRRPARSRAGPPTVIRPRSRDSQESTSTLRQGGRGHDGQPRDREHPRHVTRPHGTFDE